MLDNAQTAYGEFNSGDCSVDIVCSCCCVQWIRDDPLVYVGRNYVKKLRSRSRSLRKPGLNYNLWKARVAGSREDSLKQRYYPIIGN